MLLESFREIDHDGDGFIPKAELKKQLNQMGEPLEDHEMEYLMNLATDPNSSNPDMVNIERLSQLMVPSDDIIEDLTQQANAALKEKEAQRLMKEEEEEEQKS